MKLAFRQLIILVSIFVIVAPVLVSAGGLVPCGGEGQESCQTCHVIKLMDNVIDWLIAILSIVAGILFAYAGILLVVSQGNSTAYEKAKKIFSNVIIGYAIVLACWLLVDTVVKALLKDQVYGTWNQIQCTVQPLVNKANKEYIYLQKLWTGEAISYGCEALPSGEYNCQSQINKCAKQGGTSGDNSSITRNNSVQCTFTSGVSRPTDLSAGGACDSTTVNKYFGSQTGNAQCIIKAESACGARNLSTADVLSDGNPFSIGAMQINLTVHELQGCSGQPAVLDCKSAFSGKNKFARIINDSLYQQCVQAAQDIDCNLKNGQRLFERRGSWKDWSTAGGCHLL